MKRLVVLAAVTVLLSAGSAFGQHPDCPWRYVTGHWKHSDDLGNVGEVVWKKSQGGALTGIWKDEQGKATELAGWRPDKKALVTTGYGDQGEFWHGEFTTVTESMIKGEIFHRLADGKIRKGTLQLTKTGDDEMPTLFVGTIDGKEVTSKGKYTRVK
jgi:hypothetical protein